MKKNKMMRIASVLLVAVILTTCAISGTFAKYVTSKSGSDTARVAKFGVVIDNSGALFLEDYAKNDGSYELGDNTVESFDTSKVVAPGTTHSNTDVVLTGTPEVAVKVTYKITNLTISGDWTDGDGEEYFPIIFKVAGTDYYIGKTAEINSIATLVNAVTTAVSGYSKTYAPNTDLSEKDTDALDITWRWEFESDKLGAYQTDPKDTALGDKAALATVGNELKIELGIETTVTQID